MKNLNDIVEKNIEKWTESYEIDSFGCIQIPLFMLRLMLKMTAIDVYYDERSHV